MIDDCHFTEKIPRHQRGDHQLLLGLIDIHLDRAGLDNKGAIPFIALIKKILPDFIMCFIFIHEKYFSYPLP